MGRRLIVTIDLDTPTVEDFGGEGEMVYHILEELMYKMSQETKVTSRDVLDVNGNKAGHAEVVDGEPGDRVCPT